MIHALLLVSLLAQAEARVASDPPAAQLVQEQAREAAIDCAVSYGMAGLDILTSGLGLESGGREANPLAGGELQSVGLKLVAASITCALGAAARFAGMERTAAWVRRLVIIGWGAASAWNVVQWQRGR